MSSEMEPKRRFTPSKWEWMKVTKIVAGLKNGTILTKEQREQRRAEKEEARTAVHMIWSAEDDEAEESTKGPMHIPAPKVPLPGHAESYRPPDE